MWRRRTAFVRQVLVVIDTIVSAGAFLAALYLRERVSSLDGDAGAIDRFLLSVLSRDGSPPPALDVGDHHVIMASLLPLWAISLYYCGCGDFRVSHRRAALRYAKAVALGVGLFILLAFLFKLEFIARSFVLSFAALQFFGLVLGRIAVLEIAGLVRRRRGDAHRVLIVGSGDRAVEFATTLKTGSPIRVEIIGFVSVAGEAGHPAARPHLGYVGSLDALLDREAVDEVVFAVPGKQPELFRDALAACDDRGVDVLLTLPPQLPSKANLEIANVSGVNLPMLGLRRTPTGELRLAVKRLMDIAGGLVGIIIAGPVMIATAIAIKIDSKGPVLFRQTRAGRNGRKFTMYKFRSMVVDAEEKKAALMHLNEMGGPVFKIKRDPRITRVGRFIRRTSIDELPQFFNIFMGDMSMVGPRPPLPSEVEEYEAWQRRRLSVKPGLTGAWQVSGRNQVDFDEWMQLDLEYIDNWSLWLDIKIMAKTIPTVLFHKGAS
jgi:exopolysaccharide biosynthesis polyprenyl glycosylphosphotransferase